MTVNRFTQEIKTVKYETFLSQFSIFPELYANFGRTLLQNIDEYYLFQWDKLTNITRFNQLLNICRLAQISKEDDNIKQLISFALKNKDKFLRESKLADIGSFLQQLANYTDIQLIIKSNVKKFIKKMHATRDQTQILEFQNIIHTIASNYSDVQEIINFIHCRIERNHH